MNFKIITPYSLHMFKIFKETNFTAICPLFIGGAIYANVRNSAESPDLWKELDNFSNELREQYSIDTIKLKTGIAATRQAYKNAGKDPSRYRPACEQLARRILQGKNLYHINTIVDLVNFSSLYSGLSTAALDADQILGELIYLGLGKKDEPYEAIGRGFLNIENLPVYRDSQGAFATPTSDSTRTMLRQSTRHLLILINGYDGDMVNMDKTIDFTIRLLEKFAHGTNIEVTKY